MAHIFFEKLEDRRSTQALLSSTGLFGGYSGYYPTTYYGITTPTSGGYFPTSPITPTLLYGINPSGGYYPWGGSSWGPSWGGWGGMYPYGGYTPFSPWGGGSSWGMFGGMFSPIFGLFGGLFGMSPYSPWGSINPDIRLLYGVIPNPIPPTDIITYYGIQPLYGVQIPSNFGLF